MPQRTDTDRHPAHAGWTLDRAGVLKADRYPFTVRGAKRRCCYPRQGGDPLIVLAVVSCRRVRLPRGRPHGAGLTLHLVEHGPTYSWQMGRSLPVRLARTPPKVSTSAANFRCC